MADLNEYQRKRHFKKTAEPEGKVHAAPRGRARMFVIQKHAASRLHYDFRLELDGVLKSWAVPKGPSLNPADKRLAMHVEDHPIEYGEFEGIIPEGEYGGGTVMLWDRGTWESQGEGDPLEDYRNGSLKFRLTGEKLHGKFALVRMRPRKEGDKESWLLIKEKDEHERRDGYDITAELPLSVESGRELEQIAADADRVWNSDGEAKPKPAPAKKKATRKKSDPPAAAPPPPAADSTLDPAAEPRAKKAKLPDAVELQLATLAAEAPRGDQWLHEIKFDGYRIAARVERGKARLLSRNNKDWTARFGAIAQAAVALPVKSALLDGEICHLRRDGTTDFQSLQNALSRGEAARLVYYVFDLLHLDGYDLTALPQLRRKELLASLLAAPPEPIRYSDHVIGKGEKFFAQACRNKLEGVISKRADSPYRGGRRKEWIKTKCVQTQECVIGGWTDPKGSAQGLGALLLGQYDDQHRLVYRGKVGTGFSDRARLDLAATLARIERKTSPFDAGTHLIQKRDVHWAAPELVAQVQYAEMTEDGQMRHPSFQGLREDKPALEAVEEQPMDEAAAPQPATEGPLSIEGVRITSPDKVLYPGQGIRKRDLIDYYIAVADWILPHLARRPLSLVRCPEGRQKNCFFQKHAGQGTPTILHRIDIPEKDTVREYLYLETLPELISLVQMGTLELHVWNARVDKIERPDMVIFDLDPDPEVSWAFTVQTAHLTRQRLAALGLESFVKTTGGKGLHVVVPLARRQDWDELYPFTRAFARALEKEHPESYTSNMSKAKRKGRIFIDYVRNSRGATSINPYSTRSRPGATVSVPLTWDELTEDLDPQAFTVETVPGRLKKLKRDPWADFADSAGSVTKAMRDKLDVK